MYTLYRVYYGQDLVYLGRTVQPLARRLKDHYCRRHRTKELKPEMISRIDFAVCDSLADLYVYEVFYINRLKPVFNIDDKAGDLLTLTLPELRWTNYIEVSVGAKEGIYAAD